MKQKTTSSLLFLSLLALLSPIQSMAQSRCSSPRGRNGVASVAQIAPPAATVLGVAGARGGLLGGTGFGIGGSPLGSLGGSSLGLLGGSPLGLLGGSGVRIGDTNVGLFNGPGILNYDYHHSWMPGPGGAAVVIGTGAAVGVVAGTVVSHGKDKKKGAIIGAAAGAGGATLLWLYKNRTERRAIF